MLNVSLICLSLKYLNKNYNLVSSVSKWINLELGKNNYKESKFIKSLDDKDLKIIRTLIKFNKNVNLLSHYLIKSCSNEGDCFEIIELLLKHGANVDVDDGWMIEYMSSQNHFDIVKLLIDSGANIHFKDDYALRCASCFGYSDIVKLLIDNGADVHARDDEALLGACRGCHFDTVKLLIENGADVRTQNDLALRMTNSHNYTEIINFLKSHLNVI